MSVQGREFRGTQESKGEKIMTQVYSELFYGSDLRWSKNWNNTIPVAGSACAPSKRAGAWSCSWRWGRTGPGAGLHTAWPAAGSPPCSAHASFWGGEIYGINQHCFS